MKPISILLFLLSLHFQNSLCIEPLGKYLYDDLKCTPNTDGKSYDCNVSHEKHCIFEGKTMKTGKKIKDNGLEFYCRSYCSCNEDGTFDCAEDDCPEIRSGCRAKNTLTTCCAVEDCSPAKMNCTIDGKIYGEGSSFSVEKECKSCICQEGFSGRFEEPHCMKRRCLEQVFNMQSLQKKCAAVYFASDLCCPATWACDENQEIVKIGKKTNPDLLCYFGNKKVEFGYGFETTVRPYSEFVKVRCECTLPPFLTCLEIK